MRSIWINMSSKRCACWSRWRLVVETGGLDVVALGVVREMEALFNPHWNRPLLLSSSSRSMKSNKKKREGNGARNSRRVGFPFITSSFPGWSSSRAISSLGSIWRQHNNSSSWLGDISIPSLNSLLPLATVFFLFFLSQQNLSPSLASFHPHTIWFFPLFFFLNQTPWMVASDDCQGAACRPLTPSTANQPRD